MRKMKRGQWIAAVFGLALAGTLTFGVTFDAKAAGRSLIAGEWINMEGGPGVAQWKNEDGTIVEQPGVMPGDAQNSNLENTNDAQSSQGSSADPSQTAAPGTTDNDQTDNGRQIDPDKPMVALTFDDGPYAPVGNRIMDCLAQYGGKATFYVVGERCASYQAELQRMVAEGHEIGNHTNNHKYLNKLDAAQIREQIQKGNQAITDASGKGAATVRLPGGCKNATVIANVDAPIVLWSIDTLDWKTRNAQKSIDAVLGHVKDGDIVLMHELYNASGDAAVAIIPKLVEQGYQLVTVSELAQYRGGMENGKIYYSFPRQ